MLNKYIRSVDMDNNNQMELVDDIITFFQRLGASNELSDRNFDTGDFFFRGILQFCL